MTELTTLESLKGALMWLRLLCEELDVEPAETRLNFSALHGSTGARRDVATISLAENLAIYDAAIAREAKLSEASQ